MSMVAACRMILSVPPFMKRTFSNISTVASFASGVNKVAAVVAQDGLQREPPRSPITATSVAPPIIIEVCLEHVVSECMRTSALVSEAASPASSFANKVVCSLTEDNLAEHNRLLELFDLDLKVITDGECSDAGCDCIILPLTEENLWRLDFETNADDEFVKFGEDCGYFPLTQKNLAMCTMVAALDFRQLRPRQPPSGCRRQPEEALPNLRDGTGGRGMRPLVPPVGGCGETVAITRRLALQCSIAFESGIAFESELDGRDPVS